MAKKAYLLVFLLAGCATTPNPWDFDVDTTPTERPLELPDFPSPIDFTETEVTFDLEGAKSLTEYQVVAETNTEVASLNADQSDNLKTASSHLVKAGQAQHALTELQKEILEEERRHNMWERIGYWALIIGAFAW